MPRYMVLCIFIDGTAFNGVVEELKKLTTSVAHVLPVSDDGGSTAEIVRVLGGPAVGDIRSRCLRLSDQSTSEALAVCTLLGFRLPLDARQAKLEHRPISPPKLFIRGIGWGPTTATLKSVFEQYGEVEEGLVIVDKTTNKSKGYGFVTFKHKDGAVKALVEPSKKIDGRITVAQLASAKDSTASNVDGRKVYVGNVPWEVGSERLLECFAAFGEIEEGPLGFDKQSGRAKGFAFFVYKSEEGARRAVVDSVKSIDGHQVMCKMAVDGKKGRAGGGMMSPRGPVPGIVNTGGRTSYSGYPGGPSLLPHQNPPPSGTGSGPGYVNQGPPSHSSTGYPAGTGYNNGGYASAVASAVPEYPGQNSYRPLMNRLPPIQGGFADSGNYGPSSGYPTQPNMPPAGPRGPHGGMYQGTGSGPGYVNQGPPSHSSTGYPAGTGYNNGGYASAVAAAAPEYPGQNSYRPLMNRLPPIQGGFADSGNYGPSSGYPTQPNMPPAGPRGPHGGMYQGGHPYY
ncbi:UBP1-associated protein 2C-like protein [Tanacetum coccineum]